MTDRPGRLGLTAIVLAMALVAALVVVLSQTGNRRTGTTDARSEVVARVPAGERVCQPAQAILAGTGFVRFLPRTSGVGGPFEVTVADPRGRIVARGQAPAASYRPPDVVFVKVGNVRRFTPARVCIANRGSTQVAVVGAFLEGKSAELPSSVPQRTGEMLLRLDYYTAERESWWSFYPAMKERFGLLKASFFGSWTLAAVLIAVLVLCLGSILLAARELRR